MSNKIVLRRSSVPGKVPTLAQMLAGELAMNTTDEKLYANSGTSVFEVLTSKYSNLTAYEALSANGLVVHDAAGSAVVRSLQPVTNQTAITNGNGVSGNPIIGLANDAILPGTGAVTLPVGTTAQRHASPTVGMARFNTTLNVYEVWSGTEWLPLSTHQVLNNGMPAYIEPTGSVLTSVDSVTYAFALKSNGTRNIYLSILGDIASNLEGYIMPRNALLRGITLMSSAVTTVASSWEIRINKATTPAVAYTLPSGVANAYYVDLSFPINVGSDVALYLNSTVNIVNPICLIEISWRN